MLAGPPRILTQEHEKNELDAAAQRGGRVSYSLRGAIKAVMMQWFTMVQLVRGLLRDEGR